MDDTDRPLDPGEYAVPALEADAPATMEVEAAGGDAQAQLVVADGPPAKGKRSTPTASQQSTGKVNSEAPGWKKRLVGNNFLVIIMTIQV